MSENNFDLESDLHKNDNFDFIEELSSYIYHRYPVHPLWAKLLASMTLASVLTWDMNFYNKYGKNRMNLWITYLAPSGDFKSTPIDEITVSLLKAVGEEVQHYFILPSIASTVEGMIKYFSEIHTKESRGWGGLVVRDELTTFFKESLNKDYLTDQMEIYSKMYDGTIYPRETMKFSRKDSLPVYMNLVGATTPRYLYDQLPIQFFFQGCGNRFLYVLHRVKDQPQYSTDDLFTHEPPKWTKEKLPIELEKFKECLVNAALSDFEILIDIDAEKESAKFRNEREALKLTIREHAFDAFKREYISRDWQKSLKLAQLHCFSREFQKPHIKAAHCMQILKEDIEWGQVIVRECYEHFDLIVKEWSAYSKTETKPVSMDINLAMRYLAVIKSYSTISQAQLAFEVGNIQRNDSFYNVLGYLINIGCVTQLSDTAEFIRKQGEKWMKEQKISPSFKQPPKLYRFEKEL